MTALSLVLKRKAAYCAKRFWRSRIGMALSVLMGRPVAYRIWMTAPFDCDKQRPHATVVDCTIWSEP